MYMYIFTHIYKERYICKFLYEVIYVYIKIRKLLLGIIVVVFFLYQNISYAKFSFDLFELNFRLLQLLPSTKLIWRIVSL